jgi:hypothetical protein
MTKSFKQILDRHRGPYKLLVSLAPEEPGAKGEKGRESAQWMTERTSDPVGDALAILAKMGGAVIDVRAWSTWEDQFVLTITEADRATWKRENLDLPEAKKIARPIEAPRGVSAETVERVLEMRKVGLGYVHIETLVLGAGNEKKGFWAWKICKTSKGE